MSPYGVININKVKKNMFQRGGQVDNPSICLPLRHRNDQV